MKRPNDPSDALPSHITRMLERWVELMEPHYGASGSMDLDLVLYPEAEGPSHFNQFAHYLLLLLSEGGIASNASLRKRAHWRRLALRNIHSILDIAGNDFRVPCFSRGKSWGRIHGDWMLFFLHRSQALINKRNLGTRAFRSRLEAMLRGGVRSAFEEFRGQHDTEMRSDNARFPGNHAAWFATLFYEVGKAWGEQSYVRFARAFFRKLVLPSQGEDGFWPEGGGIVAVYGMVTAQAVSLYAEASGDKTAVAAVGRFFQAYRRLTFPDLSVSCVADCRMVYRRSPCLILPGLFPAFEGGAAFCVESILACENWYRREPLQDNDAQMAAFFAVFAASLAHGKSPPVRRPPPIVWKDVATIERAGWKGLLSTQLNEGTSSRWTLDAQNFLDLWHADSGLIVGGGNSKYGPLLSTFRQPGGSRAFTPTAARILESSRERAVAEYVFGKDVIQVTLCLSEHGAEISMQTRKNSCSLEAAVILLASKEDVLRLTDGRSFRINPEELLELNFSAACREMTLRGVNLVVPENARLTYPVHVWNPYTPTSLGGAVRARLAWPLSAQKTTLRFLWRGSFC